MRFEDSALLQRWARLQLHIAIAKSASEPVKLGQDLTRVNLDNLTASRGFRALRSMFARMSPSARQRMRTWMKRQLAGVDALKRKVEAEGDEFSYGELEFSTIEENRGAGVPPALIKGSEFGDLAGPIDTKPGATT